MESLRYDTDVDHIVSTSIIHSVNKLEAAHYGDASQEAHQNSGHRLSTAPQKLRLKPKNLKSAIGLVVSKITKTKLKL